MAALIWLVAAAFAGTDADGACVDLGVLWDRADGAIPKDVDQRGAALVDVDGDGDPDIVQAASGEDVVRRNDGDLSFVDVTAGLGVDEPCEDVAPRWGDLDGDGVPDLFLASEGENVELLARDGAFEDVTAYAGDARHPGRGGQTTLADLDGDGFLDVVGTDGWLRNGRDGTFRDVSAEVGFDPDPTAEGLCVLDADGDGRLDVLVTAPAGDRLYVAAADGTYSEDAVDRGVALPGAPGGGGVVCADLDGDGDEDALIASDGPAGNRLLENQGDGTFVDVADSGDLAAFPAAGIVALADVDLDGRDDVIIGGGGEPWRLFHDEGGLVLTRACDAGGFQLVDPSAWTVVPADLDGDGWPDLYVPAGGGDVPHDATLYRHRPGTASSIVVQAVDGRGAPAVGALVSVTAGGVASARRVGMAAAPDATTPDALVFGLGTASSADVRVTWSDGTVATATASAGDVVVVAPGASAGDADHDGVPDDWDECASTSAGARTDGRGCAPGQEGASIALSSPGDGVLLTDLPTFTWDGDTARAVVQVSLDGTFGPAGRVDWGPFDAVGEYTPTADEWKIVSDASDGTRRMAWRVVALDGAGHDAVSPARSFTVATKGDLVRAPGGADLWVPANLEVPVGTAVTWWNDSVEAGNVGEIDHDLVLVGPDGAELASTVLDPAAFLTWTFDEAGLYTFRCARHAPDDGSGRCMSGTVTVR